MFKDYICLNGTTILNPLATLYVTSIMTSNKRFLVEQIRSR